MLLFITRKYPPSVGGMQEISYRLTAELARLEEVRVIGWGRSQWGLPFFVLSAFVQAVWMLSQGRAALIHIGDPALAPLGVALRWLGHVPAVANAHGLDVIYSHPLYQLAIPWCLRRLDQVVCISHYTHQECLKRGIPAERCTVIPPGVNVEGFLATLAPEVRRRFAERWGLCLDSHHVLLTVGRLVRRKGVAPFISHALPLLRLKRDDWMYLVVGEGPERTNIERAVAAYGLEDKVRILGRLGQEDLRVAYALADLFVMPNVPVAGDAEGFGLVTLEARAAGLPVVAAALEGITEAIQDEEDGLLVPPEDYEAYARAIECLLERGSTAGDRERRREKAAARYGWPQIAHRYLELFRQVRAAYEHQRT